MGKIKGWKKIINGRSRIVWKSIKGRFLIFKDLTDIDGKYTLEVRNGKNKVMKGTYYIKMNGMKKAIRYMRSYPDG